MKTKELVIGIKNVEAGLAEFGKTLKALDHGEHVKPQPKRLSFVSTEAAMSFFTPKRLALLTLIHRKQPRSIYELAKFADRALKNVQDDVAMLARLGLIELEHKKEARERTIPHVDYDNLNVNLKIAV